jgi:hypothetical protein
MWGHIYHLSIPMGQIFIDTGMASDGALRQGIYETPYDLQTPPSPAKKIHGAAY